MGVVPFDTAWHMDHPIGSVAFKDLLGDAIQLENLTKAV